MELEEVRLGDLITLQRGFDISKREQNPGNIPVVSSGGISSYHDEYKVKGPGVTVGRKGTLGTVFYIKENFWAHSTCLWVKDFKGNDPKFIYYFLKTLHFEKFDSGAANPTLNRNHVHKLKLKVPLKKYRSKIADILYSYDELIKNNNQRIRLLEEMAEEIYKEWFVRMRFPNYQHTAFFDKNGKKVQHGQIGVIPKDWELVKINDLYKTSSGGTPSRKQKEYYEGGTVNWVKTGELKDRFIFQTSEKITEKAVQNSSAKVFPENTVLIAMYGATIGKLGIIAYPSSSNQACCAFLQKREYFKMEYIFFFLKQLVKHLETISMGAAQQNISQEIIKNVPILKPTDFLLKEFNSIVTPMLLSIKNLQERNNTLQQTRDLLLPRLISGKLPVPTTLVAKNQ